MATTAITCQQLVLGAVGTSQPDASGTAATSTTDGWVITMPTGITPDRVLLEIVCATNADTTLVVKAGTNPPAKEAALGDLTLNLSTTSFVAHVVIDPGRHLKSDGTIVIVPSQTTTKISAFALPVGIGGGAAF